MCILHMYIWTYELDKIHELKSDDDNANWLRIQIYMYDLYLCKMCIYNIHICVYYICISAHMSLTRSANSKVAMTKQIGYICKDIHIQYTHIYICVYYIHMCILYMYIWTYELDKIHELKSDDDKTNWVRIQIHIYEVYLCKRCIHNIHMCVYYICISEHMSLTRSANSKATMTTQIGYIFRYTYMIYTYVRCVYIIYKYVYIIYVYLNIWAWQDPRTQKWQSQLGTYSDIHIWDTHM